MPAPQPTAEEIIVAKRWVEEQKRILVLNRGPLIRIVCSFVFRISDSGSIFLLQVLTGLLFTRRFPTAIFKNIAEF